MKKLIAKAIQIVGSLNESPDCDSPPAKENTTINAII